MICISKILWNKLNAQIGKFAYYNGRYYKIFHWQITNGQVLFLGHYKRVEQSLNYFTAHVYEEQRFFTFNEIL